MKKKRTSVIWLTAVLVITVIAWVVYSLTVNSQLPFMDFLMVASAVVGSFGVMLEGTILYIVGYQTGLSKAQIASIE